MQLRLMYVPGLSLYLQLAAGTIGWPRDPWAGWGSRLPSEYKKQ